MRSYKLRTAGARVKQLIRSSGSVGANYKAARRAKSTAGFINKLKIVEEEANESIYWQDLFEEVLESQKKGIQILIKKAHELPAVIVASFRP